MVYKSLSLLSLSTLALAAPYGLQPRSPPGNSKVIVQMFQWNWESIAAECAWLGANGISYVQVSPPTESISTGNWWDDYQAVSYKLTSKHGNEAEFGNMVNACKFHGVGIIVDLLWNDMAGVDSGTGLAGTKFTHYSYPGLWDANDFHYCGTPGNAIQNWGNAWQVQTCQLANLADLNTSSQKVQRTLAAYANALVSKGVAGFRVDASKHIATSELSSIMNMVNNKNSLYWTHEVVDENGSPIHESSYTGLANFNDVQEFKYTTALCEAFTGTGSLNGLHGVNSRGWLPSGKANTFVVNHDRERSGCSSGILNYASPNNAYKLAQIFALAYGYGTPTIFSGFSFSNINQDSPNGGYGNCNANSGWVCQHRWQEVIGMVGFYKQTIGTTVTQWVSASGGQVAFARNGKGYVIINYSSQTWKGNFVTGLKDGSYCDITKGKKSGNACTGIMVKVAGGQLHNYSVPAYSAVAIHIGQKL